MDGHARRGGVGLRSLSPAKQELQDGQRDAHHDGDQQHGHQWDANPEVPALDPNATRETPSQENPLLNLAFNHLSKTDEPASAAEH